MSLNTGDYLSRIPHRAYRALRDLSAISIPAEPARHRVGHLDAIVAATAHDAVIDVLHYDRHFLRLAKVLNFEPVWFAEPGSIESVPTKRK